MAQKMGRFRQFLKPGVPFAWTEHMEEIFQEPKQVIIAEIQKGVRIFDMQKPTCLATDWSKMGLDSGYSKSTVTVHILNPSAVEKVENHPCRQLIYPCC